MTIDKPTSDALHRALLRSTTLVDEGRMEIDRSELRRLCEAATPITEDMIHRYEHGGCRVMRFIPSRDLVADLYRETDRECWIACRLALPALLDALEAAEAELERTRMQLAACGVIAMANTSDSAKTVRSMHPDYDCASTRDVASAVDREMEARKKLEAAEAREKRLRELLLKAATYVELTYNEEAGEEAAEAKRDLDEINAALAETAP